MFRVYPTPKWIGKIEGHVEGTTIVIRFDSRLVKHSKDLDMVVSYCPQPDDPLGFLGDVISILRVDPRLWKVSIADPGHP